MSRKVHKIETDASLASLCYFNDVLNVKRFSEGSLNGSGEGA